MPRKKTFTGPAFVLPPAPPKPLPCHLCRDEPRQFGDFFCRACRVHEERCRLTARRVNRTRKANKLPPTEERGRGL